MKPEAPASLQVRVRIWALHLRPPCASPGDWAPLNLLRCLRRVPTQLVLEVVRMPVGWPWGRSCFPEGQGTINHRTAPHMLSSCFETRLKKQSVGHRHPLKKKKKKNTVFLDSDLKLAGPRSRRGGELRSWMSQPSGASSCRGCPSRI